MSIERPKDSSKVDNHSVDNPDAPTGSPSIDRAERKRERIQDVIAENHSAAISMLRFEKLLSNTSAESVKAAEQVFSEFPAEARERYQNAFNNYQRRIRRMDELLKKLETDIEREQSYGITETEARERLAHRIYRTLGSDWAHHTVNPEPVGVVTLDVKEGYMLLKFDNHEDYKKAAEAMTRDTETTDETAGLYGHATYIGSINDKYMGPVLLVRNDGGTQGAQRIVVHERQHFINHEVFGLFSSVEHYPKTITDAITYPDNDPERKKVSAFARIKDEVIAYMRDGSRSTDLKSSLRSKLYSHLFEPLTEDQKAEAWKIIDETAEFISNMPRLKSRDGDNRAIIIYQLVHVPFAEFPKWLSAMKDYYFDRFNLLQSFDMYVSAVGWPVESHWQRAITFGTYPSEYRQNFHVNKIPARQLADKLRVITEEVRTVAFDQSNSREVTKELLADAQQRYEEIMREFSKVLEPLKKNGVILPSAIGNPRTYKYGEDAGDSRGDTSEQLGQIREEILNALVDYPQEKIDAIVESYVYPGDGKTSAREQKHFESFLKKIIHRFNNNQACSISIFKDETTPHSLEVSVDFQMDKETKKRGIKGAEFVFELHGSKLKF